MGWTNIYHININRRKAEVAIWILDFAENKIPKTEKYFIKGLMDQKDIVILNVYVFNMLQNMSSKNSQNWKK